MYIIKLADNNTFDQEALARELIRAMVESTRFEAEVETYQLGARLSRVRLRTAKPYCGQHPGQCFVGPFGDRPKRRTRWLEWDDWVDFHALVNSVLDQLGLSADAWTNPPERLSKGKRMFVRRKDLGARKKYEWEDDWSKGGFRPIQIWNHGTEDQFR